MHIDITRVEDQLAAIEHGTCADCGLEPVAANGVLCQFCNVTLPLPPRLAGVRLA